MGKMKLEGWQPAEDLSPIIKLLAEGEASFTIRRAYSTDRAGNPLLTSNGEPKVNIQLQIKDKNGDEGTIYDNFSPRTLWKIKSICDSIGKPELYQPEFDYDEIIGCVGKLNIVIEQYNGKPRNNIKNYIKHKSVLSPKYATAEQLEALEDDIPF